MNILLLCDEACADRRAAAGALKAWAETKGHRFTAQFEPELGLKPCLGCFGCWTRTPGSCVIKGDGGERFLKAFLEADRVLFLGAAPYGCFALGIKKALDRFIPTLMPFFRRFRGEMHHVLRYPEGRRLLMATVGELGPAEAATFRELRKAYCDNAASPYQTRDFAFKGEGSALVDWFEKETAS